MSIAKTIIDLEKHLDYAQSYLKDLENEVDGELENAEEEIKTLKSQIEELEENADEAHTQIQELMYKNSMLQLELTEVTSQLIHIRHELDLSRKGV